MFMRRHQNKVFTQQLKKQKAEVSTLAQKSEYKKWLGKMHLDQKEIRQLTDHADRNELAAKKVDIYTNYLSGWLNSGESHQNDVLTQNVVWATDGQRWDILFNIADPAIDNPKMGNLHWMKRDLVDFVADGVMKVADAQKKAKATIKAPVEEVLQRIQDEKWGEINHIVKARFYKFCGIQAEEEKDWKRAVELFAEADELYPNISVKGKLKTARAELKKLTGKS